MQHKTLAIALSALLMVFAGPSLAQHSPEQAQATTASQQPHGARHQHKAQHQARLKEKLQLRADQQTAWDSYRQAMESQHPMRQRAQRGELQQLSTPERIAQTRARHAERAQAMEQRLQATQDFYDQLDTEQKSVFDQQTQGPRKGKRGHFKRWQRGAQQQS